MSLTDNANGMVMPVSPMNNGGAMGYGGDWSWWIIILFLFAFNGGWGNGYGGTNGDIQRGFDQSALTNGINNLQNTISNGFAAAESAEAARQMSTMQQLFALQQGLNTSCCENRAAIADVKYAIANDGASTRTAINASTQQILDKLCQQEIDALKEQNSNLRTQLNLANLAASQNAQTSQILADNAAQTQALEHYLNPTPIPAYMVQNPNCCSALNNGCGCNA